MPGSPYVDTPPGLLTWPRALRWFGLPMLAFYSVAAINGVLFEAMGLTAITVLLVARWQGSGGSVESPAPLGEDHDEVA